MYHTHHTTHPTLLPILPLRSAPQVYTALSVIYLLIAASCYAPETTFDTSVPSAAITDVTSLLKHTWAPGLLLSGVICSVLQVRRMWKGRRVGESHLWTLSTP